MIDDLFDTFFIPRDYLSIICALQIRLPTQILCNYNFINFSWPIRCVQFTALANQIRLINLVKCSGTAVVKCKPLFFQTGTQLALILFIQVLERENNRLNVQLRTLQMEHSAQVGHKLSINSLQTKLCKLLSVIQLIFSQQQMAINRLQYKSEKSCSKKIEHFKLTAVLYCNLHNDPIVFSILTCDCF